MIEIDKTQVKRILVITLSNTGDIILTTPVIATLRRVFPASRIDVVVGPRGREIFEKDPAVTKLIIYDKHAPFTEKRRLQIKLRKLKYDLVVDLKNTVFQILIAPRYRTSPIYRLPANVVHSIDRHLHKLSILGITEFERRPYVHIPADDEHAVSGLLSEAGVSGPIVVVNPGAKSHLKRWVPDGFAAVADRLKNECGMNIVMTGLAEDAETVCAVVSRMKTKPVNLAQRTNIRQLASLIKRSKLLVTNDSAPLHIGCAVGTRVLAIFGPTDHRKYGPTGEFDVVVNKKLHCSPCERAECEFNYECMRLITADEVFDAARMMVEGYG
jgi:ADP-heptose:LPS heptosyltransferase